jgi:hypothetical protein
LFYRETELGDEYKLYLGKNFVYDYIKDNDISITIDNIEKGNEVDLSIRLETQTFHSRANKKIHINRIAQLVINLRNNKDLYPISFCIGEEADFYNRS